MERVKKNYLIAQEIYELLVQEGATLQDTTDIYNRVRENVCRYAAAPQPATK